MGNGGREEEGISQRRGEQTTIHEEVPQAVLPVWRKENEVGFPVERNTGKKKKK